MSHDAKSINAEEMPRAEDRQAPKATSSSPESSPSNPRSDTTAPSRKFLVVGYCIFYLANTVAASYSPIQDCDEVFNYWEPTHYLTHGFGLQTWEYSPEFAIRSWLYIVIHAVPGKIASLLSSHGGFEFFLIRNVLGVACTLCETRLFSAVYQSMGSRIAILLLIIMVSSSGMFHASVAYLPSSFSMYTTMLGMAAFLDVRHGLQMDKVILWFGIGAIVGWPFSAALILPLFFDILFYLSSTGDLSEIASKVVQGVLKALLIVPLDIGLNAFFFRRIAFSPWRIISYNIFSGASRGPDIFGTEPANFYLLNLLLNFNVWFLLAILASPILALQAISHEPSTTKMPLLRTAILTTPFYMWLTIFSVQPHKEERFMYPVYPFLCVNAAITLHNIVFYLGQSKSKSPITKIPVAIRLIVVVGGILVAIATGVLRTVGTVKAYSAPLEIYGPLQNQDHPGTNISVCLGKEWYRFPSSYFLPKNMRARFVKSAFDGLLPGQFSEATTDFGLPETWLIPSGMNDRNLEDPGKHIDINECPFLVDSAFLGFKPTVLEPKYILDNKTWEALHCSKFLDASMTHPLARIFWIPDWNVIPSHYRRSWGEYCLLSRKSNAT